MTRPGIYATPRDQWIAEQQARAMGGQFPRQHLAAMNDEPPRCDLKLRTIALGMIAGAAMWAALFWGLVALVDAVQCYNCDL